MLKRLIFSLSRSIFTPLHPLSNNKNVLLFEIEEAVIIVKDYNGNAYLPSWNYNAIGNAIPGQGYQIKTNSSVVLW